MESSRSAAVAKNYTVVLRKEVRVRSLAKTSKKRSQTIRKERPRPKRFQVEQQALKERTKRKVVRKIWRNRKLLKQTMMRRANK